MRHASFPTSPSRRLFFSAAAAATLLPLVVSCSVQPPHYVGDTRGEAPDPKTRPGWTQDGMVRRGGYVWVTGAASGIPERGAARSAAEADARDRLAAALETQVRSELEWKTTTTGVIRGDDVVSSEEQHLMKRRVETSVDQVLQGVTPVADYDETRQVFGEGWQTVYDAWVHMRVPEKDYDRQLSEILASSR